MDRCLCWNGTKISITIQHCPSVSGEIAKEVDKLIQFAMKQTELPRFGKVTMSNEKVEGPKE